MRMKKKTIMGTLLLAVVFMSLSCATPQNLKSSWRNSTYTGPAYKKMMVVVMTRQAGMRQSMENEFARQLKSRGVEVATCHEFIPDPEKISAEELVRVGKGMGIEGYLIARLLGTGTEARYTAPAVSLYQVSGYLYVNQGKTQWNEVANLESLVYDGKTSDLVWRATVDVVAPSGSEGQVSNFVSMIVKTLSKDKMIP